MYMTANDTNNVPLSANELNHYTNLWCRERGIHSKDLEKHPRADDIVLLLRFREELWHKLNRSEQGCWAGYWSSVYKKRNALKSKALNKLEQITITANDRHLKALINKAKQRQKIRQLRQNPYSKSTDNIAAKDVEISQTVPWE